ncbi:MAG: acetoin utilization protein AcuC [Kiritimatiellae bacterium]|nr:acetoin utilization protein AcuC [Kiritimatiellia bacterium]
MNAAFLYSAEMAKLSYPPDCPFKTERAVMTRELLASMGLLHGAGRREAVPRPADRAWLERFHTPAYVEHLQLAARGKLSAEGFRMGLGTPDCPVFADMYEYPRWAVGATTTGADLILAGEADVVFNPSGGFHHARAETAAGFCYLNDLVLACMRLAGAGRRVLYLDVDVHHGDGVQEAFYARRDVLTLSFHENGHTLFPGSGFVGESGEGDGTGYSVNVPLPPGTFDEEYLRAFRSVAVPIAEAFDPGVVVCQFGMDTLAGDPLAHLRLTNNAHAEIARILSGLGKPLLVTGGGGYNVPNTVRGWALVWSTLCGGEEEPATLGLGGVMLESTEWRGGLRDRAVAVHGADARRVHKDVSAAIEAVRSSIFPRLGL